MMRKIVNVRLAAGLAGAMVLLGISTHLLHGKQMDRLAGVLRDRAQRAQGEGRLDAAEDYLRRYLVYRPTDVASLIRYAELLERGAADPDVQVQVLALYTKALRREPERAEIRRKVILMEMALGDFGEGKTQAEILRRAQPQDAEAALLLGRCEEGMGRFREAAALYEEARKLDPTRIEAFTRLAAAYRQRLASPDRADAVMDARAERDGLVATNPKAFAAYLARAVYRQRYAVPGVDPAADIAKALALAPDDPDVLLASARTALARGAPDEARKHLEHGIERYPDGTSLYQALADLERGVGRVDEAVACLRRGIGALPEARGEERTVLQWMLADLLNQAGRPDPASELIARLKQERVRPELLKFLEASNLVARDRYADATRGLREVYPLLNALPEFRELSKRALVLLGRCYERLGNADQRLDAFRLAVAIDIEPDPMRTTARFGLAASLVALDKIDEALDEYRRIPNDTRARVAMARLQILQNFRKPDDQRRWDDVGRTLDAVERGLTGRPDAGPALAQVTALRAEALVVQGRADQARELLQTVLAKQPDQVDLWVALANLVGRSGQPEETLTILDDARKRLGDRTELRLARVGYWARQGGDAANAALTQIEEGAEALGPEGLASLRRELAAAHARLGHPKEAERIWRALTEQQPDDLNVRLTLFDLALRNRDETAARETLAQIQRIEGEDGTLWRFARAILLIEQVRASKGDRAPLAEARAHLEKVALQRPSWSRVPLAQAEIDTLEGRPEAAIRDYLRAIVELGERNPSAIRRAAQLLGERQRFAEADLVLKRLRDDRVPLSGELQRLAAQVSSHNQNYTLALEQAEKVVSDRSDDYRDLIWLGQLRWAAGQPAETAYRRAVALARDTPEPWLALILYLAGSNRKAEAQTALAEAEKALDPDKGRLALALAHEAIGTADRASELYREALKAHPDDLRVLRGLASYHLRASRLDEAEPHLRRIIELGGASTDAAWARRVLASVLAARGDHRRTLQALEILGINEGTGSSRAGTEVTSPEDVRTRARILALQPSRPRRREAIALLEGLTERRVAAPDDTFLLAQLLEADGDWPKARQRMLEVIGRRDEPVYLASYIRALLRHKATDEARIALARLEKLIPGRPAGVELKARLLGASGQGAEAATLLTTYGQADDTRLASAAALCEEIGQPAAAERLFLRALEKADDRRRPEAALALASFLGRLGRVGEALDLLDARVWPVLPPERSSNAALSLLYAAGVDQSPLHDRVTQRVETAIRERPTSISLRFDLANLRILQRRYAEAEAILREVHNQNKAIGGPLNNLAWLLALRGDGSAETLKLINQAIALEGETPDLLDTRALAHLVENHVDLAIRDLEDAIAVSPTADKYFHLARVYLADGRRTDAIAAFNRARELGLRSSSLHPLEQESFRQLEGDLTRR